MVLFIDLVLVKPQVGFENFVFPYTAGVGKALVYGEYVGEGMRGGIGNDDFLGFRERVLRVGNRCINIYYLIDWGEKMISLM